MLSVAANNWMVSKPLCRLPTVLFASITVQPGVSPCHTHQVFDATDTSPGACTGVSVLQAHQTQTCCLHLCCTVM